MLGLDRVTVVQDGVRLLDDVTWSVERGEHWAVLGPNGSGKTTLLRIVAGYLWPSAGTVSVLGKTFGHVDLRDLRRRLGWVSPALAAQLAGRESAWEVVVTGRYAGLSLFFDHPTPQDRERADILLDALGVSYLARRPFEVLSQGEGQRVLLARALMADPDVLILDEPTAGLDLAAREDFLEALDVLTAAPDGPTVLFVTHHLEEIVAGMTHVLLLRAGAVVAAGLKEEALQAAGLSEAMGVPLTVHAQHGRHWAIPLPGRD